MGNNNRYKFYSIIHFYNAANMKKYKIIQGHNKENDTSIFDKFNNIRRKSNYTYQFDYIETITNEDMCKRLNK